MSARTILVLGGYGYAGKPIVELLLKYGPPDLQLIVAGRRIERANQFIESLDSSFGSRCLARAVDANSQEQLKLALQGVTMLLVASSTLACAGTVIQTALEAKVDYLDVQLSSKTKHAVLNRLQDSITEQGLCFITDGGCHPGLPAAMMRYVGERVEGVTSMVAGLLMAMNFADYRDMGPDTINEFFTFFREFQPRFYADSQWKQSWMHTLKMDFGEPFGVREGFPMHFPENEAIPTMFPSLKRMGTYVTGFHWVVDYLITPVVVASVLTSSWLGKHAVRLFYWGCERYCKPPYKMVYRLDGEGEKGRKVSMTVSHEDPYYFTAAPTVACLLQYFDRKKVGLFFQSHFVETDRFFKDLKTMGLSIEADI